MKQFEIFFKDLTKEAQERFFKTFNSSKEEENLDYIPLAIIDREDDKSLD
jgi:hypothetical protein